MRVPDIKYLDILLKYDRKRSVDLTRKTEELSSGKKLLYPSDNPVDAARALRFKKLISTLNQYNRNIDLAKTQLETAESALDTIINVSQEARAKIVQIMNTGVINEDEAKTLKDYFENLKSYIIGQSNTKVADHYIFGGVKTQTKPFNDDGTYQGETQETTIAIANGVETNTTFNGKEYLGVNYSSNKILIVEVIDKIISLIDSGNLQQLNSITIDVDLTNDSTNNPTSIKLLDAFDKGLSKIMEYRSIIGTKIGTAENLKVQNENMRLHYSNLVSKIEDADYTAAIAEYEKAKTAYEALLATIQQTKDLSLLKYYK
ncbi:flagellar hook-associated protein 3 [Desulfurobacterium thermolithotrophum DSM 11699]|uniref:Flagellar hook-associated protein 3 n=1 Tax=Desulfurobacterium thermolithotrophum (strain DSM 11699 / BSA) TaxID=868864 RepID=F0S496_DESTD|nr:flagellar hook-associated protein FlgL [Desulfurobacterium thermolithotrophum]ADY73668.1 flagellar hook-associated protein 3 [Desulfurobacterium thermolithotrophum DSM 11699]